MNVVSETYGSLLCPILLKLIPSEITLEYSRSRNSDQTWNVNELKEFIRKEIESRERATQLNESRETKTKHRAEMIHNWRHKSNDRLHSAHDNANNKRSKQFERSSPKTYEYAAPVASSKCIYCDELHDSERCEIKTVEEKRNILKSQARCFLCLKLSISKIKHCKERKMCEICKEKHNRSICFQLETKSEEKRGSCRQFHPVKKMFQISQLKTETFRSALLQTCTVMIRPFSEKDNLEPVRILLDNGSMRSFIIRDISEKCKLPVIRKETLSVFAFGVNQATEQTYNVVKVKLENRSKPSLNIEIEALETNQIYATNLPFPDIPVSKINKDIVGLQLADSYEFCDKNIAVLIGADYYHEVITSRLKRFKNKLIFSETIFGWCLQGRTDSNGKLLNMDIIVDDKLVSTQLKQFWELETLGIEQGKMDLIQKLRANFWNRWSVEYLTHLQNRSKWNQVRSNLKAGQLVLLKDKNKTPMKWTLARIEKTFPGPDGLVRVVDVRTSDGIFRRAVSNISSLQFPNDVEQLSNGGRDVPV
ncbi:uncharacterized protein LOC118204951 [Stegodyphus dumicola]|uniref:uncharacterized protein LOC118204951 n=1 Tax=Stegodyphus dumicola TaxID=202533 RepID=UPI0015A8AC4C|nr:uncharacterized protein LOC118204951 [Stegodyphus dumicola]